MRRWLALLSFALPLAACMHSVPVDGAALLEPYEEPLQARILPFGSLSFAINRAAHVAVFEVVPGRGVGLLYPAYSHEERLLASGYHHPLGTFTRTMGRWFYASSGWNSAWEEPRFLYLVASTRPLRLGALTHSPGALRSFLGLSAFSSYNAFSTMEALTSEILPLQSDADWATDVYVMWPTAPTRSALAQLVRIRCANGRVILVPITYGARACPGDERITVARETPGDGEQPGAEKPERTRRPRVLPVDGPDRRAGAARAGSTREADGSVRPVERSGSKRPSSRPARTEPSAGAERPARVREDPRVREEPRSRPAEARPQPRSAPTARPATERPAPPPSSGESRERTPAS